MDAAVPHEVEAVTAAWLRDVIGPVTLHDVRRVGADHGFASVLARVRGTTPDGGPVDLVVKLGARDAVEREAWVLGEVAPHGAPVRVPGLRACVVDDAGRGALVMDHVEGEQGDVRHAVPEQVVGELLGGLAALHHRWDGATDPVLDEVRAVERPRFLVRPAALDTLLAGHVDDTAGERLRWLAERAPAAHEHVLAGPRTLVHGDVHLDNVLLTARGPVLLDWEGARIGTAAEDVARVVTMRTDQPSSPDADATPGDPVEERCAAYTAAVASRGGRVDDELVARVRSALVALAAGMTNWAGRLLREPPDGSRRRALADEALDEVLSMLRLVG